MVLVSETSPYNDALITLFLQKYEILSDADRLTIMRIIKKIYFPFGTENKLDKDIRNEVINNG